MSLQIAEINNGNVVSNVQVVDAYLITFNMETNMSSSSQIQSVNSLHGIDPRGALDDDVLDDCWIRRMIKSDCQTMDEGRVYQEMVRFDGRMQIVGTSIRHFKGYFAHLHISILNGENIKNKIEQRTKHLHFSITKPIR